MASDLHLPKWLRGLTVEERAKRKAYVKAGIRQLRRLAHGFGASDGYSLTDVRRIHSSRIRKVLRLTPRINEIRATPHVEKSAHSASDRKALRERTRQEFIPRQKRFLVHVPDPKRTTVKIKHGRVEEIRAIDEGEIRQTFFPLPEQAVSFDHIADMAEQMDLPEQGHFVVETASHGAVKLQAPIKRSRLSWEMREFWSRYDGGDPRGDPHRSFGFAPSVTGFRMISTTAHGRDVYALRAMTKRQLYYQHHLDRKRTEFGMKPDKSARVTGRRGRTK